ncbi:MAG: immunoglobulin domain-containing protein [Candidatus Acidiferrum sp.]
MNMSRRLEGFKRNLAGVTALAALAFCISGCAGIADSKTKVDPPAGSPAISGVTPSQVTSSGATISWNTDQASSSQVNYGTTASYGTNTTLNSSMVSSHSASLSGLKSATLYHYRVNSSNAAGNLATSGDFTFTTASGSDTTPPTVSISSPASGAIASGTITLTATASDNVGVAGVQFQVDNVNSGADDTVAPYTLALDTTKLSNGNHSLTAVASDAAGNHTTSAAVSITVVNLPVITSQPASQTVTVGQTATFVVAATGAAPLTYQWKKNGTSISGATASSYTTPATISANNGSTFQVVVSNAAGSTPSATVTLTVDTAAVAPTITSQPVNQTVTAGQTATFSVVATGTAPLTYQWKKNSANIAGATAASYTTPVTTSADNGSTFQVVVSNGTGSAPSTTVTLTVNAAAVAPTIITQPVNQTVTAGQTATFSVVATGTAPLSYQWSKNGANITGATSATYTTPATTSTDDGSTFQVVVSNGTGSTPSNIVTLTVASSGGGPGTAALVQHVSSSNTRGGGSVNNAFTSPYCYHFQLPNFTTAGNTVVVGFTFNSNPTPSVHDDKGNSYSVQVNYFDSTDTQSIGIATAFNVAAGARLVSVCFSSDPGGFVQPMATEFDNVVAVDGSGSGAQGSGTSVSSGSLTPSVTGDLAYQVAFSLSTNQSSFTAGSQSNISWSLLSADILDGWAAQYGVYNSTSPVNPTFSMGTSQKWISAGILLKTGATGGVPSGMRIVHLVHENVPFHADAGGTGNPFPNPTVVQFPSSGNLLVAMIGGGFLACTVTDVTDNNNNAWAQAGATQIQAGNDVTQAFYAGNANSSGNLRLTVSWSATDGDFSFFLYDVTGAAVAPLDTTGGAAGSQSNAGNLTMPYTISPAEAGELLFTEVIWDFNTGAGLAGSGWYFDTNTFDGENQSGPEPIDQNNGWGHFFTTGTAPVSITWIPQYAGLATGNWSSTTVAFKPAP